ncbi:MAG: hypothetical protein QOC82_2322 [Frankiaceae bacterium]|nr:hypothetical protein [Frankiaceae bacterium]
MKRFIRTLTVVGTAMCIVGALTPAAHADDIVYINGLPYRDAGVVTLGGSTSGTGSVLDPVEQLATREVFGIGGNTCVPSSLRIDIGDASADRLLGSTDMWYHWEAPATATAVGCPNNVVTIRGQLTDQALDGSSPPTRGDAQTASGRGSAGVVADLWVRYPYASSLVPGYHTLTMVVTATQSDNKTTTGACATKSWTYLATVAGPQQVGSTVQRNCAS